MTAAVGIKALLDWVNCIKLSDRDIPIDDLQDGTFLLKLVHLLKKDSLSSLGGSKEDRFRFIADFVERNCRFSTTKGTPVLWDNIRDGNNSSVEIAKVLLLLLYHDMMNDRCTLNTTNTLEPNVQDELAHLTDSFVIESDGCVHLSEQLDAYLAMTYIPVCHETLMLNETTRSSTSSLISSLSDYSPVFHRTQRVSFVDTVTVASSSLSKSPLEEIMNTPKFQIRKMKRQMITERDYRDNLERELASKQALAAQRESRIIQLQYRLDKLKEEQKDQERLSRNQLEEFEAKSNMLQMRLNEMLKENKDLKSTSLLMEHKVDELTDENGALSSQMKTVCSQLVTFEAEIGRLTQTQASAQEEWRINSSQLQSELEQATAQKELLTEQIQILQGKIACLEDEIIKATKEEVGENMGSVIEREILESEISDLKIKMENTVFSLNKAEIEAQAKTQQLAEYRQEIAQHQELLKEEKSKTEETIRAKDEVFDKIQKEMMEQRAVLQQEIQSLKVQLEQAEQQKSEQTLRLQQQVDACKQDIEKLQEVKKEKEDLLLQFEEKVKDLETRLAVASALIVDEKQQINVLKEEVNMLTDKTLNDKCEIQALTTLLLEKSNEQENLNDEILTLTAQIDNLGSSLKKAECEIQLKQDQLNVTQLETVKEKEVLQQQIMTHEAEAEKLKAELQEKNQQLVTLKSESSEQTESLDKEIKGLKVQLEQAEQQKSEQTLRLQQQVDTCNQDIEKLQEVKKEKEDLSLQFEEKVKDLETSLAVASASMVDKEQQINVLKEEVDMLTEKSSNDKCEVQALTTLLLEKSNEQENLNDEILTLTAQIDNLGSSLKKAECEIQLKQDQLNVTQLETVKEKEVLQQQIMTHEAEAEKLKAELQEKNQQLVTLESESSEQTESLDEEIQSLKVKLEQAEQQKSEQTLRLRQQVDACNQYIKKLQEVEKEKEDLSLQFEEKVKDLETSLAVASALMVDKEQQINVLKEEVDMLKDKSSNDKCEVQALTALLLEKSNEQENLNDEILTLTAQIDNLGSSLKKAECEIQLKQDQLNVTQLETVKEKEVLQQQIMTHEAEAEKLKAELQEKNQQLVTLESESSEQTESLDKEIKGLKVQLEQAEQQKSEQTLRLQQQVDACNQDIEKLQEVKKEKEDLLLQFEEKVKDLETRLAVASASMVDKEQHINVLKEEVDMLTDKSSNDKCEVQALTTLLLEKSNEQENLNDEILTLTAQIDNLGSSLKKAECEIQLKQDQLNVTQLETVKEKEVLQQQIMTHEAEAEKLKAELQEKNQQLVTLESESSEQTESLDEEIKGLKGQLEMLDDSLRKAKEQVLDQEEMLTKQQHESASQKEVLQHQLSAAEEAMKSMKEEIQTKEVQVTTLKNHSSEQSERLCQEIQDFKQHAECLSSSLRTAEENLKSQETLHAEQQLQSTQCIKELQAQVERTQDEVKRLNAEINTKEEQLDQLKTETSTHLELLQQELKEQLKNARSSHEQLKNESSKESVALQNEIKVLKDQVQQLDESLRTAKEQADNFRQKATTLREEEEAHVQEKQELQARMLQAEKNCEVLEKRVEATALDNERLAQANQTFERENVASQKFQSMLQQELKMLTMAKDQLLKEKETAKEGQQNAQELQGHLTAKSEAADHYKTQMETAVKHYNDKKQLLQKSQEEVVKLKHSHEVVEREVKALTMENQVLQLDFDKAQTNEKKLLSKVASLESQLAFADCTLRAQRRIRGTGGSTTELNNFEVPIINMGPGTRVKKSTSADSLSQSSLEDSLNTTTKLSFPEESSTPLVRSSERLAAKRKIQYAESLETLYFTPINTRHTNRTRAEHNNEGDSVCEYPTSSVKRRRTTQVINITMSKKTPGGGEEDETFYSLASARSHPNLSTAHSARPVPMKGFETLPKKTSAAGDQLIGLPGYRQSTVHSQSASTFCVGTANEPDSGPEDWWRIAELQARNKACLPHLKSSYPLERETGRNNALMFSDEELRTGDPSDTIRRASMMPGQLQDSLVSHRQSLIPGQTGAAGVRSHRLSLMPGHLPYKSVAPSQLRSLESTNWSPSEKKTRASCFPRPLTPKNKNVSSGPASSHLRPALSPAERRQSTMFVIENSPNKNNYLKKGLNKLLSSTRKSPGKSSKKSPAPTSARTCKENKPAGNSRAGAARGFKSPEVATRGSRKSPRATSRPAKSPGLTASARKMMRRMKV